MYIIRLTPNIIIMIMIKILN